MILTGRPVKKSVTDRPLRLLLIDDNPHDRQLVERELRRRFGGVHIKHIRDAAECDRALASSERFDAAIIDYQLQWSSGLEVLRQIKLRRRNCPVIMFTASGSEEVAVLAMKEGLDDYVTKTAKHYARLPYALEAALKRTAHRRKLKRYRAARRQAEQALREQERRKDEFIATLAHELRNPLAPIRYATRLLEPGVEPRLAQNARRIIDRQLTHIAHLLDELLDSARISRGALHIHREPVDLCEVLRAEVDVARGYAEPAGVELSIDLPVAALEVDGDAHRLVQVMANLLENAVKYTPRGGRVWVRASQTGAEALVVVRDNGMGISAEMLPRVFDPFVQGAMQGGRKPSEGLGLGLSLSRELLVLHGGSIEASSGGSGCGAEFRARLPLTLRKSAADASLALDRRAGDPGVVGQRVLIVDDNADAADVLQTLLCLSGHEACVAYDGQSALATAERVQPDVVLLDIGLPDISGHEVGRQLRERRGESLRLIAISGWGQEADRSRSARAGFDAHLTKPVDAERLLALLASKKPQFTLAIASGDDRKLAH